MKRLTKTQKEVLSRMKAGERLRIQLSEPLYFFDGSDVVNARTVRSMESGGVIRRANDGLFQGDAQTFEVA